jgi:hypothetical protein
MGPDLELRDEEDDLRLLDFLCVAARATPGRSAAIAHNTTSLFSMVVFS